jgi:glycosyltransferase involved in cell wall biosynthesis
MMAHVTVAIPVYNGEDYISEALQSILAQTRKVDQIIICDNHSTDNTVKVAENFLAQFKEVNTQIIINEKNIGGFRNFNKCMELCTTDYLLLLGADDRLKPYTIEKQLKMFKDYPDLALIGGRTDHINEDGKIIKKAKKVNTDIFNKGQVLEFISKTSLYMKHSTILLNTNYTKQVGLWDLKVGCDERYSARVLKDYPIAQIGESLADERIHLDQGTKSENKRFNDKILHFEENLKVADLESSPERKRKAQKLLENWIASQCIYISRSFKKDFGDKQIALKYWLYGLKRNPKYYLNIYFFNRIKAAKRRLSI